MGKRAILILAVVAVIVYVLQKTPLAFLPKDAADFAGGFASGLVIASVIAWMASRSR